MSSGTSRVALLALAFAIATLGPILADQFAIRQLIQDAAEYRAVGASVLIVEAPARISGPACESLARVAGVTGSGAMRAVEEPLVARALPSAPIAVFEVTGGFPQILAAEIGQQSGIVLSAETAAETGVGVGDALATTSGDALVAGVYQYPDDGRRPGFGYAALIVTSDDGPFDECWLDAWPQSADLAQLLLTAVVPSNDVPESPPALGRLNQSLGSAFGGTAQFDRRITQYAPAIAAVLALVLAFLAVRLRRLEIASARHAGVSTADLLAIALLECVAWIAPVVLGCATVATWFAALAAPADRASLVLSAAATCGLAVLSALGGTVAGVLTTRERQLFRYAKDR